MKSLFQVLAFPLLAHALSQSFSVPAQAPLGGAIPFTFRNATLEDIDDMVNVFIDAFRVAPAWSYIRQFADKVSPGYIRTCQREIFEEFYRRGTNGTAQIKVMSVPDKEADRNERVVSLSAWSISGLKTTTKSSILLMTTFLLQAGLLPDSVASQTSDGLGFDCKAHLDMNMTRVEHFSKTMSEAEKRYLFKPYSQHLMLELLATHPEWDGNGFGARHLHWGKKMLAELNHGAEGKNLGFPITLMATPAGYPLYISEGFVGLHNATVERLDGKGIIWLEAMKFEQESD